MRTMFLTIKKPRNCAMHYNAVVNHRKTGYPSQDIYNTSNPGLSSYTVQHKTNYCCFIRKLSRGHTHIFYT